jgi:antitoxin HigA-1
MTNGASAFDGSITMRGMLKSWTITNGLCGTKEVVMARLRNPHPGEILKKEFLSAIGMSQNQLAHSVGVPGNRIHAIVNGTRDITGDTDLRLCKFFGLSEGYFLRLQNAYDTLEAKRRIAEQVTKIKPYKPGKAA